jgi:site-specific recombinase XerD
MARHLTFVREPRKNPMVLSPQEVTRLLEAAPGPKYKAALRAAYGAGLRVSGVVTQYSSDARRYREMRNKGAPVVRRCRGASPSFLLGHLFDH